MKLKTRSRLTMGMMALIATLQCSTSAMAQESPPSMFGKLEPTLRDRMFMRLDYIRANVKSTVGEVRDVSGPVVGKTDIRKYLGSPTFAPFLTNAQRTSYRNTVGKLLEDGITADVAAGYGCETEGLGTPCGTRARGQAMIGTPAISVGYFLGDEHTWAVEAFVLAKPVDVAITGDGPNAMNGKEIIQTKLLPPVLKFGRYFGAKGDKIRPYAGLLASYAIFFDTKATSALNDYVGGANPKDTSVQFKNSFGLGWMLGARADVSDEWHVAFNVGKIRYKTNVTLTTQNTVINSESAVLRDYGPRAAEAVLSGDAVVFHGVGGTTQIMCDLAQAKYENTSCNQGTYTRKANNVLDNTLFVLSVGRSF